jgi:hypothetical protein
LAGKSQAEKSPHEISRIVHEIGTNRLILRKTVSFFFCPTLRFHPVVIGFSTPCHFQYVTVVRPESRKSNLARPAGLEPATF